MKLTEFFLKRPLPANLLVILIVLTGSLTLFSLKRATYPTVDFDILKITTTYPGASAHDIEVNVTKKLEDELDTVDGIEKIKSNSVDNLSLIYVFVDTDADNINQVKDDVRRAVDRVADLPKTIREKPKVEELRSANVPVIEVAAYGNVEETTLRKIVRDLKEEIVEIAGVMSVELIGHRKREVKILVDANKLAEHYVSLNEVITSIRDRNVRASGGNLESYLTEKKIVTFSEFEDPMEVKDVIVRSNFEMQKIPLTQIATIENSFEDYDIKPRTNGKTSINLLVRSHGGGDIIDISHEIRKTIKEFEKSLPKGVTILVVSDFSYYTDNGLSIVKNNAIIGFFLVLICLVFFLDRYSAPWIAAGIPLSILGAISFFPLFGMGIDFITLITMVIVLGMLVDDAIVIGENISRHREAGVPAFEAALIGVREVFWPVTATVLTTIIAFFPLYMMVGITGKFVRQMPTIVILTLLFSLFEAAAILPTHLAHSPFKKTGGSERMKWFQLRYRKLLRKVLAHRWKALIGLATIPIVALILNTVSVKFVLFPYTDIDMFFVVCELDEGSSLDYTTERVAKLEAIVAEIPEEELVNFTTRVGHHDMDVYGGSAGLHENWALIQVFLKPAGERDRRSEIIIAEVSEKLKNINGFKKLYTEKFYDGPPIGKPVTITYVTDDDDLRRQFARETYELLAKTPGIQSLDIDEKLGKEELRLNLDHLVMARLGLTARNVADMIRAAYDGVIVSELTREGEEIDFRVQLKKEQRESTEILKGLQVLNPQGRLIRLDTFASLTPSPSLESIKHYNRRRSTTITSDVDTEIITSIEVNQIVREKFAQRAAEKPGLKLIFGGEEKSTQESMTSFYWSFLVAVIAIYFLLTALLGSFIQPFLILSAVPIGLAGVVFGFFVHQLPLSFLAITGSLGLIGVVVNDSLVMVSYLNAQREKHGGNLNVNQVIEAAVTRLRPVLLTTITTVVGLTPTIYGFGGYEPFLVPIVLAIASGLIIATMGTLVLIPVLYSFQKCCESMKCCATKPNPSIA